PRLLLLPHPPPNHPRHLQHRSPWRLHASFPSREGRSSRMSHRTCLIWRPSLPCSEHRAARRHRRFVSSEGRPHLGRFRHLSSQRVSIST
ncbi:hypothetical protein PMAYCL1PPCAC_26110, partial [Pristionchus mayeri]